jgi:hypothetical protein
MRSQTLERGESRKKGAVSSALTASLQSPTSAKDFDHIQNHPSNGFGTDERRREDDNAFGGIPIHKRTNNYGESSRGRHGREYFDDDENSKSIGRQHGSFNYIEKFGDVNDGARTIPQVHVYAESANANPISKSFENLEVGMMASASPTANGSGNNGIQPSSPVIVVHTNEMDEDAGNVGLAGTRNRSRSFSSLLLLEAQEIRSGSVGSPRQSQLNEG